MTERGEWRRRFARHYFAWVIVFGFVLGTYCALTRATLGAVLSVANMALGTFGYCNRLAAETRRLARIGIATPPDDRSGND